MNSRRNGAETEKPSACEGNLRNREEKEDVRDRPGKVLAGIFVAVMLCFALFMAAEVLTRSRLDFQLDDLARSLETSKGRERKQQYEYDQVTEELPRTRAELAEAEPRAEAAKQTVAELKEERKRLRNEKKELEERERGE